MLARVVDNEEAPTSPHWAYLCKDSPCCYSASTEGCGFYPQLFCSFLGPRPSLGVPHGKVAGVVQLGYLGFWFGLTGMVPILA
jgi:hypothetical protein